MALLKGWRQLPGLLVLASALAGGCSDAGGTNAGDLACSPLEAGAPAELPLARVLGIGRHADGMIYVLDESPTGYRVFSSEGSKLKRRSLAGSGSGRLNAGDWYVATVLDSTAPFTLKVDDTSGTLQMGVVRGVFNDRDFTIGETGDVLEVEGADALNGMVIQDLPDTVYVEYWAHLSDGRALLVIRPDHDWSYEDFRLFLGTADRMSERPVASVQRAKDGGTTTIIFTLDGTQATAYFPSTLSGPDEATLTANGSTSVLTKEPAGDAPPGAAYFCL